MPVQSLITEHQGGQRRMNGKSVLLAYLNVRFHSKKIFSHILVWSGDSSSENRISSKLAVISTSSRERERERTCSIKEISTNFMQIMGKYRENIRKEQRELILKVVPIIWFELLTLELGQGLIWHFLSINNHRAASQNLCRPPCPPPWWPHQ